MVFGLIDATGVCFTRTLPVAMTDVLTKDHMWPVCFVDALHLRLPQAFVLGEGVAFSVWNFSDLGY